MPTLQLTSKRNQRDFPWPGALLADVVEPSWAVIAATVRALPNDGSPLYLSGGEPTLRPDWAALLIRLAAVVRGRELVLVSNGRSFFYPKICDALAQVPQSIAVEIGILSARREVHDRVVEVPESFDQASRGIQQLIARGRRTRVRILVGRHNVGHLHEIAAGLPDRFAGIEAAVWDIASLAGPGGGSLRSRPDEIAGPLESALNILRARQLPAVVIGMPPCFMSEKYRVDLDPQVIGSYREPCGACPAQPACPGLAGAHAADPDLSVRPILPRTREETFAQYDRSVLDLLAHYVPSAARNADAILDAMCGYSLPNLPLLRQFFNDASVVHATDIEVEKGRRRPEGTMVFQADLRQPLPQETRYDFIALFKPPGDTREMPLQPALAHLFDSLDAGGHMLIVLGEHSDVGPTLEVLHRLGVSVLTSEANVLRSLAEPDHKWVIVCRAAGTG